MRAIQIREPGGPEVLHVADVPTPEPGAGELLIRVAVAGVNFADIGLRSGMYHPGGHGRMAFPLTPGFEVTGTVAALGDGVMDWQVGQRVGAVLDMGGYAEYAVVNTGDPAKLIALPEGMDFATATALLVQGPTAHGTLYDAGRFQPGEAVLVQAAAGGVGSLAVQLARIGGAGTVVGTAGSDAKRDLVRDLGGVPVDYTQPDWANAVRGATGGRGVDVVLESVGGDAAMQAWDALAPLGRVVMFGAAGGRPATPDMMRMNVMGQSMVGFGGPWLRPGRAQAAREAMVRAWRSGDLRFVMGPDFPLADAAAAHAAIQSRVTTGKVVLRVSEEV